MSNQRKLLFILSYLLVICALAQTNKRRAVLISRVGDDYYKYGEYLHALHYYQVAFEEYPEYVEAQFQIAQCYRLTEQYDSATFHYQAIISHEQDFRYPLARYYLGMLLVKGGKREEAVTHFKAFRELLVENEQHQLKKFKKYYEQAEVEIEKIGLN